ncbi:hypothetical protein B0H14DRAFT_2569359 [Mycena olivaceomarginata]|nr:hypothetical protein B0H14DRAFT_2569359 [Mycena olivaceomarginata]
MRHAREKNEIEQTSAQIRLVLGVLEVVGDRHALTLAHGERELVGGRSAQFLEHAGCPLAEGASLARVPSNFCDPMSNLSLWMEKTLGGCGHSFCEECLANWFRKALTKHTVSHPGWKPISHGPTHISLDARIRAHPYLSAIVVNNGSQPEYTCPKCRKPVLTKPMEDYSLKEIVQTVSGTEMEERGKFETGQGSDGEMHWQKQKEKAGPFDDFFGRAQS